MLFLTCCVEKEKRDEHDRHFLTLHGGPWPSRKFSKKAKKMIFISRFFDSRKPLILHCCRRFFFSRSCPSPGRGSGRETRLGRWRLFTQERPENCQLYNWRVEKLTRFLLLFGSKKRNYLKTLRHTHQIIFSNPKIFHSILIVDVTDSHSLTLFLSLSLIERCFSWDVFSSTLSKEPKERGAEHLDNTCSKVRQEKNIFWGQPPFEQQRWRHAPKFRLLRLSLSRLQRFSTRFTVKNVVLSYSRSVSSQ
jgi:hypothetical protein